MIQSSARKLEVRRCDESQRETEIN
jgi:hypothetical protein